MAKRRRGTRGNRSSRTSSASGYSPNKMQIVMKNLFTFLVLFLVSFVLFSVISDAFWENIFFLLLTIFGFVTLALFIAWLVLWFVKATKK